MMQALQLAGPTYEGERMQAETPRAQCAASIESIQIGLEQRGQALVEQPTPNPTGDHRDVLHRAIVRITAAQSSIASQSISMRSMGCNAAVWRLRRLS
jgi:hypothetical protein